MDGLLEFVEGQVVGKVSEFKVEAAFVDAVNETYGRDMAVEDVTREWVRWVPKAPVWLDLGRYDNCLGAYITCNRNRGAFEVFMVD